MGTGTVLEIERGKGNERGNERGKGTGSGKEKDRERGRGKGETWRARRDLQPPPHGSCLSYGARTG